MTTCNSSCAPLSQPAGAEALSRVTRWQPGFQWQGVPVLEYQRTEGNWCGISRRMLIGDNAEATGFHVRYFEIAPDGYSAHEEHAHVHTVLVLRGRGQVQLGETVHELNFGDVVYVAPHEWHQFRNTSAAEPFGFLCIVDVKKAP